MNNLNDFTKLDFATSSLSGVARGLFVNTLVYPLEVIKIQLQCSRKSENSIRLASILFQREGLPGFYRGLSPQLLKMTMKQFWCWPLMIEIPNFLRRYRIGNSQSQMLTGLCIATIDATMTAPLERLKILYAAHKKEEGILREAVKNGWQGYRTHWAKLSITWVVFLTTQKYFRDQSHLQSRTGLSLFQLMKIGAQVALIVSLVAAPFDITNTLRQAQNLDPWNFFTRKNVFKLFRGWPLNAFSLVINNIASVILIEKLSVD